VLLGDPILAQPLLGDTASLPVPAVSPAYAPVTPTYATDVAQYWNSRENYADFQIINNGLGTNQDLVTAIIISLFSDRLADASDTLPDPNSSNRRGWWADTYDGTLIGSRLWLLSRAKSSPQLLLTAQGYAQEALQWLIDDGVCSSINVQTWFFDNNQQLLGIGITIYQPRQSPQKIQFQYVWSQISSH
jgi:phage gp46-like protein